MRAVFIAFFFSLLCGRAGAHFTGPRLVGENARTFTQATKRDDARGFKDQRLGLTEETHTEGLWAGWTVLFVPDLKGRVGVVKIVGPNNTPAKEFTLGYDGASRLSGSSTPELPASYGARDARGNLTTLTRGGLVTEWGYHEAVDKVGLLSGVSHTNNLGNDSFAYTYPSYNQQRQIVHRHATRGVSWAGLSYDGSQQLGSAVMTPGRRLDYGYNTRGTRTGQGAEAALAVNLLDQVTRRTLQNRGFGLIGSVDPRATVRVSTPVLPGWQKMDVDAVNGGFSGWWRVPANFNNTNGAAVALTSVVRGTLLPLAAGNLMVGDPLAVAVADATVTVVVPPVVENLHYDMAGRLADDGFWTYRWDGASRLIGMTRKAVASAQPLAVTTLESVTFGYDADGRRTSKSRFTKGAGKGTMLEESKVLWAGWLPVMEERTRTVSGVTTGVTVSTAWLPME